MNNITDLYNELADSLDDFKALLSKPCTRSPEVAQQLLLLTAELVKSLEFNRRGEQSYIPNHLVDNVEASRAPLSKWLDELEVPEKDTNSGPHYITEYVVESDVIKDRVGILKYNKVTPIFADGVEPDGLVVKNRCFLYDDYSSLLKPGDTFYEITFIEVKEDNRRKGIGTWLVEEFLRTCKPKSVILQAGITTKELYDKLCEENRLTEYIYENLIPFYNKLGFTDVNNTVFYFEESVPMLWPQSRADEAKRKSEEFRRQREQERYKLDDFLIDPQMLVAVMEKHGNYVQWFKDNFPNGALYKGEVLKKLSEE